MIIYKCFFLLWTKHWLPLHKKKMTSFPFESGSLNGILYHMMNSGETSNILVTSSSVFSSLYPPDRILEFDRTTIFCSQTSCENNSNTLSIELKDHHVYLTGYSIRSNYGTSNGNLRSWKLEGSFDNKSWTLLHSEFDSLNSGSIASFPLHYGPFSFFRITQTGESYGITDSLKCRLRISAIEFFGFCSFISYKSSFNRLSSQCIYSLFLYYHFIITLSGVC